MIEEIKTSTTEEWEKYRHPELLTLYRENVYGYCPFPVPETVTGVIQDTERTEDGYIREEDLLYIEHYAMPITLFYPVIGSNNKIVIYLRLSDQKETDIPIKMITDRGYTLIQVWVESIASDAENCLQTGLFRYFNSAKTPDSCGALGAWSYGLSRVMDFILSQPERFPDPKVIVAGFSRGGKCSLWTAASDERFAMVAAFHSGTGGAELCRDKRPGAETVAAITTNFPYWFCDNFAKYGDCVETLPVEQHMLLGLIAPRGLFLTGAADDPWADMESEKRSAKMASSVYKMYQKDAVMYFEGREGHKATIEEWEEMLNFADRIL